MESFLRCTICSETSARYCPTCRSAIYCSPECQQADWRPHRLLCRSFQELSASSFAARPSPKHFLAIYFPMASRKPKLVWVDTEEVSGESGYFNPKLDQLLHVPGNERYIGRGLACIEGNKLRGRNRNVDTLNIWYLDDMSIRKYLSTNQTLYGTSPTLVDHTWGEKIWEGSMVAVLKVGHESDPRQITDITLTAYRDAIDYLGYFLEGQGSIICGVGTYAHLGKQILRERAGKVKGVRINCLGDQAGDPNRQMVQVEVPKTHPLFNLEGDDPLDILENMDEEWSWVVTGYPRKLEFEASDSGAQDLTRNPLARLLLLQVSEEGDREEGDQELGEIPQRRLAYATGSILVVDRTMGDLTVREVRAVCKMVEEVIVPLIETYRNDSSLLSRTEILEAIKVDTIRRFLESGEEQ